ncbi:MULTISPECIES: tetratricopeptide repeat protein [unclassified Moorena]|uniref:tetratricopeptide repeat protein n=1 Tax=unclassified Moorena TaxID=2683338 RepID=UPI0013C216ED|nr:MULTISPECIES: tetratricopeptide repeat protein [unclassified Moorena]NEO06888.1 tetratricopeptide repeat protein [Moorena sp. SIO3I8]NEO22483.1 tetratricopeptide repeat protein [Moorena sp. SIO4A5]NEQ60493.1 tetratricopeptide repeat protein [Moorena sp. SIO4A1]
MKTRPNPRFWEIPAQSLTAPETIPLMKSSGQRIALKSTTVRDRVNSSSETLNNRYYNRHTFEGKAGEQITIELTSDEFDPSLILIDPDGNRIAKDNNSGEGKNARITVTLPTTGTYVILANSYNQQVTGNYTLSWRAATPSELLKAKADQLLQQGIEQDKTSQFQAALKSWQEALRIYRQLEDRQGIANSLNNLGLAYYRLGEYGKAIEFHQQSLSLSRELEDRQGQANSLGNLGLAYYNLGQYRKAIEFHQQSLSLSRELKYHQGEAASLGNLGLAYGKLGQYRKAIEFHQQSLTLARELKNRQGEAHSLNNLGLAYRKLGQYPKAIEFHQQSLSLSRELEDRQGEAYSLNNLGLVYDSLGQYRKAIEFHQQSLSLFRELGDRQGIANSLNNLGNAYRRLGQYRKAIEFHQQSLSLSRELEDRQGEAYSLNNLGLVYDILGQYRKAIEFLQQSLSLKRELEDRQGEAYSLNNLGLVYHSLGQYRKAIEFHQQSLSLARELEHRQGEAYSLGNLGNAYRRLGQYRKAIEFLQQSLSLAQELEHRQGEAYSLNNLGLAYDNLEQYQKAIEFYKQAIKVKESIQGDIKVEEFKTSYASQQVNTYENLINLLWNQKDFEAAFNYVERARAKAFLDQLANGRVDFRAGADSKLLEREQDLKGEINALSQQLITLRNGPKNQWDNDRIPEIENNRTALRKKYQDLLVELKVQNPEIASLKTVEVASLPEIQSLLDADTTLVEYFVTDERTLAFIITRNSFHTVPLNVTRQQLTEELTLFQDFADLDEPHPLELKNLHDWLIVPLQPHLNTTTITIVPHSILHYLPFAALTDGKQYLSDNYALLSLPSASILRYLPDKGKSTTGSLLALGDPTIPGLSPLTHAQKEVETIAQLFKTKALVGKAATESALRSRATQSGIIHLAVHGEYNLRNPLFSAIRLLEDTQHDGSLEVHEVYGLDLTSTTNLVVLSACQTKIGELSRGDEVVGLTRAFLYAGTPTIIASLWNVDDAATGLLMKQFYSHWQGGMNKAEALQQAQKDLRETYPHPYFWAAFSLTGDAGNRE